MINATFNFIKDIIDKRSVILELVKRDIQQQYVGSFLGATWVILHPLLFVVVLYAVFSLGFRSGISDDMPFSLYLMCGIIAWMHFASIFTTNTSVIRTYSFLVKSVDFRLSVLPLVTMLSALVAHLFLLSIAILLAWYQGYEPSWYTLQLLYYLLAMNVLLLGLGWLTSSTSVFIRDVTKIVTVMVQFGFWLTPIFWNISRVPDEYHWIIELNPMYYIVTGYRDSIVGQVAFWDRGVTLYYWGFVSLCLLAGISVFRRLRPHIAEVI